MKHVAAPVRAAVALTSAAVVGLAGGVSATPAVASSSSAPTPACLDLPLPHALVTAVSCVTVGVDGVVVGGTLTASPRDGAVAVVRGQHHDVLTLPGAGSVRVTGVSGSTACLESASGAAAALDLARAALAAPGTACPALAGRPLPRAATTAAAQPVMPAVTPAASGPAATTSYYVYANSLPACGAAATTGCPLYVEGAQQATPAGGGLVVLDLGSPCFMPGSGINGTQLFGTRSCTPNASLLALVQAWLRGYASTHGSSAPSTILAVGTSNSLTAAVPGYALTAAQMAAHGTDWFRTLVSQVSTATVAAPVTIWGASDIEQDSSGNWYGPTESIAWVDAFAAAAGRGSGSYACTAQTPFLMADYGDDVVGNGGWSAGNIYHVAWGSPTACPVPEIYYPSMAQEWAQLNSWAVASGLSAMTFTGVMSEGGIAGTLSSSQSWSALQAATGQSAPYLTIIASPGSVPQSFPPFPAGDQVTATGGDGSLQVGDGAGYSNLGGVLIDSPAVVALPQSGGQATPLYVGIGSDLRLWETTGGRSWQLLSQNARCLDGPGLSLAGATLTIACAGLDRGLWVARTSVGSGMPTTEAWHGLGGILSAGPAVVQVNGSPEFVVTGGDGHVWSTGLTGGYAPTPFWCIGQPGLAVAAATVYLGCQGMDHSLLHGTSSGGPWSAPVSAGGVLTSGVGVAAGSSGVTAFALGTDSAVWGLGLAQGGGVASPWTSYGGSLADGVGAAGGF